MNKLWNLFFQSRLFYSISIFNFWGHMRFKKLFTLTIANTNTVFKGKDLSLLMTGMNSTFLFKTFISLCLPTLYCIRIRMKLFSRPSEGTILVRFVALSFRTWHWLMVLTKFLSIVTYIAALVIVKDFLSPMFIKTAEFVCCNYLCIMCSTLQFTS